ncbi:hypothetical protein BH09BAC2_BH09BAC2_19280 [soil metagenome]
MNKLLFTMLLTVISTFVFAQTDTIRLREISRNSKNIVTDRAPQVVYAQIGGSAPIFSVNYDRRFAKKVNGFGFAVGAGFWGGSGFSLFSIPASINYLIGNNSHFVELAAGTTFYTGTTESWFGEDNSTTSGFIEHINVGYRYQPTKGGFFFRGGISPLFAGGGYGTSFYLGFGHNF